MNTVPVEHTLSPCPLCGSKPDLDWTGVAEYRGHAWQDLYVSCSNPSCSHSVSIATDSDRIRGAGPAIEATAVIAWNALSQAMSAKV